MRHDRVAGVALVLTGIALAAEATTFDVGFLTDPVGPKALPFLVAVMVFIAGVVAVARPRPDATLPGGPVALRIAAAVVAFLAYAAALPWIGFFLATTLVVTALSLLYRGPPGPSVAAAALFSGGLWFLFVRVLSLPLPVGDLWIR